MAASSKTKEFERPVPAIGHDRSAGYQFQLATSRAVETAKDLEGLKIRTTGGTIDLMMRSIGGVPVRWRRPKSMNCSPPAPLDGLIFLSKLGCSYDFGKILKSGTEGLNFGTAIFTYSIGRRPIEVAAGERSKALVEAGEQTTREGCKRFEDGEKAATEKDQVAGHEGHRVRP